MSSKNAREFPLAGAAVVRIDLYAMRRALERATPPDQFQFVTFLRVFWNTEEAMADAARLNEVNADKDCVYVISPVHVQMPASEALVAAQAESEQAGGRG